MTLLIVSTLSSCSKVYKWKELIVSQKELQRILKVIKMKYSEVLVDLISRMVVIKDNLRPGFNELNGILSPHREKIQKRERFVPNY